MASGPFHRRESPTQTRADAVRQVASGEIWGRAARGGANPSVKAYRNSLPPQLRGIEFTTPVPPHPGSGSPYEAKWYHPDTPGVVLRQNASNEDFAAIPADVVNLQP